MAIQLADDRNVARGGTTAMAGTALGISIFDLLLRGNGNGGLFGAIGGGNERGVVMHDTVAVGKLEVATAKDKEITTLQIQNSELKARIILQKQNDEIAALRKDMNDLSRLITLTPAWATATTVAPATAAA